MNIYLKNTDTIKPRIKKLKKALLEKEDINASLGLCRDLISKSLGWDDWNSLYLAHQKPGHKHDRTLLTGRWSSDELNQQEARANLEKLIAEHLGDFISSHYNLNSLARVVWPGIKSEIFEILESQKATAASSIPPHYLRDNILVDIDTEKTYKEFTQKVTIPFISNHGGIIFCTPNDAQHIIERFHNLGEKHGVIINSDYRDLISDRMFFEETQIHHIEWGDHQDESTQETILHLSHIYAKETITKRLSKSQITGEAITLNDITDPSYPMVVICHTDDFLGHVILSAFMNLISRERAKIACREKSAPTTETPKLLVLGLNDQIQLPGFAMGTHFSGVANLTVMMPQYNYRLTHHQYVGTEIPIFVANVSNIFSSRQPTLKQIILRQSQSKWHNIRNFKGELLPHIRTFAEYRDRKFHLNNQGISLNFK